MAIEVESKLELSCAAYQTVLSLGVVRKRSEQINVYYDSAWKLADSGATFRIRFTDSSLPVCTLKIPIAVEEPRIRVANEIEAPATRTLGRHLQFSAPREISPHTHLGPQFIDALSSLNIDHLSRVGWVRNCRTVLEVSGVGRIELDRLRLPTGETVYEAEFENDDREVIGRLSRYVVSQCPDARPSVVSKFERFRLAASKQGCGVGPRIR